MSRSPVLLGPDTRFRFEVQPTVEAIADVLPHAASFNAMRDAGGLVVLLAYAGAALVGYAVNDVRTHLHYADLVYAENHVLFASQAAEHAGIGVALIQATEAQAKARGARMLAWHAKEGTPLDLLLPRLGYGVQDVIHAKEL